jgi:hypothetical protein
VRRLIPAVACVAAAAALPAPASAFTTGFTDGVFLDSDPAVRASWLDRTQAAAAETVEFGAAWSAIAPTRPKRPVDPGDPAYRWDSVDAAVRDADARGLRVVLQLTNAPRWAEGRSRRRNAPAGTWRPDARAYGQFAEAAARRYSGSYVPAGASQPLPRVRTWQLWGEANIFTNLNPQWVRRKGRWRIESPGIYRALLNAGYRSIHGVQPDALVLTAGSAPFGDVRPSGRRIQPVTFWRKVLCIAGRRCTAHFDGLAHDPYSVGSPQRRALNRNDVSIPDMRKLTRVLRAAARRGTVRPRRSKQLWVTEVSYDSSPPDPDGVPARRHARWVAETLEILWRAGVDGVVWFQIRDAAPDPSYGATYQSGMYFRDGRPKRARSAFRFPFVARKGGVWGRAPAGGAVVVERRTDGGWVALRTLRPDSSRIIRGRGARRGTLLRARQGADASLAYRSR